MRGKEEKMKRLLIAAALAGMGVDAVIGRAMGASLPSETNEVAELPPVPVYASRIDDTKEAMPAAVSVFTAADIESSGARDLPELLKKKAGIDIFQLNSNPMQSEISMRGFGESSHGRTKILLDGETLNNVDMAAPNLMRIPIGSIERVEIVHGPSPVLHGDGAVAGVVNIITDTRDYEKKTRITGKAGSQSTFGGNVQTKGGFEDEGVLYGASYDYLRSDGYRKRSAYEMHTANAAVRKNFENGSTVAFKANYQNAFYELPGSLTYDQWKHARKSAQYLHDWNRVWTYGMGLESKAKLAEDQWLYLDGGFSQQRRAANWGNWNYCNLYDVFGFYLSPRYVNEMDIAGFGNKFTAGVDLRYDRDNITDHSGANNPKYHFGRMRYAAYLHDEFYITDELSIVAGARLENIRNRWTGYRGLTDTGSKDWMDDYELGLVWRPVEGLKTYVKGTRFHRSPFCDEMNYTQNGQLLRPETGTSFDIGAEWKFLKEFTFDLNGYGMVMEDEIFYNPYVTASPYGWSGYNSNSPAKTRRLGLDAGLSWLRDKVAEAAIRYGAVQADFSGGQYNGNDVPRVPHHRIRLEAGFWILGDLEIKGGYRFVSSQYLVSDFNNEHGRLPGYSLFDIGAYYSPSWAKGWKATFVMDNIFDRNYCDFAGWTDYGGAYYYPACGRSFMVTLSYEF